MTTKQNEVDAIFNSVDEAIKDGIIKANANNELEYDDLEGLKQGSKAWFKLRLGKFTGSKIPDLMKSGRAKTDLFGETAKKVIRKVSLERNLTDVGIDLYVDEMFNKNFRSTEWGNNYESYAREAYSMQTGNIVDETCFQISKKHPFIGGSFDGTVRGQKKIVEIKCPYDVLVHDENVQLLLDVNGPVFPKNHTYYGQIQCNIFVGEADSCDFVSYDPRINNNSLVIINVPRDEEYITEMLQRIFIGEIAAGYCNFMDIDSAILMAMKDIRDGKIY